MEDKQLTPHFKLSEFLKSDKADEYNIENIPNDYELENIQYTAEQLEIIRNYLQKPIVIKSGFRCEELNKIVKGAKNSYHKLGLAVDLNFGSQINNYNFFTLVKQLMNKGLPVDELIDEYNLSWVHISFTPKGGKPKLNIKYIR